MKVVEIQNDTTSSSVMNREYVQVCTMAVEVWYLSFEIGFTVKKYVHKTVGILLFGAIIRGSFLLFVQVSRTDTRYVFTSTLVPNPDDCTHDVLQAGVNVLLKFCGIYHSERGMGYDGDEVFIFPGWFFFTRCTPYCLFWSDLKFRNFLKGASPSFSGGLSSKLWQNHPSVWTPPLHRTPITYGVL